MRPPRGGSPALFPVCAFALCVLVSSWPVRSYACTVNSFVIAEGLDNEQKAVGGQKVIFKVGFEQPESRSASAWIDYGDGTADNGERPLTAVFGSTDVFLQLTHVYTRAGTFTAVLKGASMGGQSCLLSSWFGLGLVVNGRPATRVTVVDNPSKSRVKRDVREPTPEPTVASLNQKKGTASISPWVQATTERGTFGTIAKDKVSAAALALAPGQISRASVATSVLQNVLKIEGSGRCGLRVFETLDGAAIHTYSFNGSLPTTMTMLNTLPGLHVLKIEGDKTVASCGGTATTTFPVAKRVNAF